MDNSLIWEKTRQILAKSVSPTLLKIWFTKTKIASLGKTNGVVRVVLGCPNKFLIEQVEKRCGVSLVSAFEEVLKEKVALEFTVTRINGPEISKSLNGKIEPQKAIRDGVSQKKDYTFENFVVGGSNRLAYSAAVAASKSPGFVYNPLFIYARTGLGKTHLLHAIAAKFADEGRGLKVGYKTTEAFINEFVDALVTSQVRLFREKNRNLDVLLIDDVHFLSGKPSTQEEFFHTFNELYSARHQIVLTSDRHPTEIGKLEERLVSRFLGGLTVDIGPPELELKMAILLQKAKLTGIALDNQICQYLATLVNSPREIEGTIAVVDQLVKLGEALNLETIKTLFEKKQKLVGAAPKQVIAAVAKFYGLKTSEVTGAKRKKELVRARQMAMFLLRKDLGLSFDFIGQILGARDHSTVIHGVEVFEKAIGRFANLREDLLKVKGALAF